MRRWQDTVCLFVRGFIVIRATLYTKYTYQCKYCKIVVEHMIRFRTVLYGSDVETIEAKDHFKKKNQSKNIIKRRIDYDFVVRIFCCTFMFFRHGIDQQKFEFSLARNFFDRAQS